MLQPFADLKDPSICIVKNVPTIKYDQGGMPNKSIMMDEIVHKRFLRCAGFCDQHIFPGRNCTKYIRMDMANTNTFMLVCTECGYVWQDVDQTSMMESGDCNNEVFVSSEQFGE